MKCIASIEPVATGRPQRPEPEPGGLQAQRVRDRRAAVSCLQAAARTADAVERNALRRRAAELILPWKEGVMEV